MCLTPASPKALASSAICCADPVKVMRFKAAKGETLHFRASGADAADALSAIVSLVQRGFVADDEESAQPPHG